MVLMNSAAKLLNDKCENVLLRASQTRSVHQSKAMYRRYPSFTYDKTTLFSKRLTSLIYGCVPEENPRFIEGLAKITWQLNSIDQS